MSNEDSQPEKQPLGWKPTPEQIKKRMNEIKAKRKHEKLFRKPKKIRTPVLCKGCGHKINVIPCLFCQDQADRLVLKDLLNNDNHRANSNKTSSVSSHSTRNHAIYP